MPGLRGPSRPGESILMKCDQCGEEHDTLYLSCDSRQCQKRSRTRCYIIREHGQIIAICVHCETRLASWPDASESGEEWTDKQKPN